MLKSETKKLIVVLSLVLTLLTGALLVEQKQITDSALRSDITRITSTFGALIVVVVAVRGFIIISLANIKASAPRLYEDLKTISRLSGIALMSLIGCGVALFNMSNNLAQSWVWPAVIAATFAGTAIFCLWHIWKSWKVWKVHKRMDADQHNI